MRRPVTMPIIVTAILLALGAAGCDDDDDAPIPAAPTDAGGSYDSPSEPRPTDGAVDSNVDAAIEPIRFLARFDATRGELPEGVAIHDGAVYASLAPLGQVVRVDADGTVTPYGALPGSARGAFLAGLQFDDHGDLFAAAGFFGDAPHAAIYRIAAGGGEAVLFADLPVSANDVFPDGMGKVFVSDSIGGAIYVAEADGTSRIWSNDPLLAAGEDVCTIHAPFPIGPNGIELTADALYVTNTLQATLVRIPVLADGSAGPAELAAGPDCAVLAGADGIVREGGDWLVAVGSLNAIARITPTGERSVAYSSDLFDLPASLDVGTLDGRRTLVVSNFAFASSMIPGATPRPGVIAIDLE